MSHPERAIARASGGDGGLLSASARRFLAHKIVCARRFDCVDRQSLATTRARAKVASLQRMLVALEATRRRQFLCFNQFFSIQLDCSRCKRSQPRTLVALFC